MAIKHASHDKSAVTHTSPLQHVLYQSRTWDKVAIDVEGLFDKAPLDCRFAVTLWPHTRALQSDIHTLLARHARLGLAIVRLLLVGDESNGEGGLVCGWCQDHHESGFYRVVHYLLLNQLHSIGLNQNALLWSS